MDLIRDQDKILQILNESDNDDDDSPFFGPSGVPSDSEPDDNLEEDLVEDTDEIEDDSSSSSDEDLNVSRRSRNRNRILDSDDDSLECLQPCPPIASHQDLVIQPERPYIYGKNKHKWATTPRSSNTRASARNIIHFVPGPNSDARDLVEPLPIFHLYLSDEMIDQLVIYTNAEIEIKKVKYKELTHTISPTSAIELKALLGLLMQSAAIKSNHLPTRILFDDRRSGNIFKACMSAERFDFLLKCLRFDDKATRQDRRASDKFAPIREFWEKFIGHCKQWYKPSSYLTIDEQLVGFRGRCPFRIYIPNKPNKYGIKIVMVADSNSKYVYNATPYLGKGTNCDNMPLATHFVKQLCEPVYGTNRNITMDNWFTSVPLASELLQDPYKLTLVGTIRSNKREIPPEMKNKKSRKIHTSMFAFDGEKTLVSYKPKSNKTVFLLSTVHSQPDINSTSKKPEIIHFYNSTKGAVDTVDQMCSAICVNRKTNRWPQCVFYNVLNLCLINSYVIYVSNMVRERQKPMRRRSFVQSLADKLIEPWLRERYNTVTLRRDIKASIKDILKIEDATPSTSQAQQNKRKICSFCPYKKHRMTKYVCSRCKTAICGEHTVPVCADCQE
ncbi:piggyBac transposable element-derived protein 4-like [Pieris napi]|uniref:piggyBac transposable element-derived protein 4-like n=1 Tax=Pieris napi TaxID=78633 RepID=UPI001FB9C6A8|nr:piggyBac transposable element-derived protein 4-like [Pieris napi]XP_047511724.1 piggyBac transposable element-derived protein 4-like [Pieris napi]XP_047513221.1 piggyBac transposable element-derived protein 4-like [Pieris napi]XP_047518190.1 piggyBac transposable element-derived protein 4-like [Pieris napi]XP_047518228.1 piggyBac transposable element-derived protein 4-like [Pieris napi]XP_047518366.1 piggyBac transposable element-derived protein 4-like [Pieris napi]